MRIVNVLFLIACGLFIPTHACAQGSSLPEVPIGLSDRGDLTSQRLKLEADYEQLVLDVDTHRAHCKGVPPNSPLVAECQASQSSLNQRIAAYKKSETAFASAVEHAKNERRQTLEKQVARDVQAIRQLGLNRRAEDFVAWEELASKAKNEFEGEVFDTLTDIAVDKARGGILEAFKSFDTAKATRLVEWIRARGIKPEPSAFIAAIQRVGNAPDKTRVAEDAEFIVKQIEDFRKGRAAASDPVESAKFVSGLLESTISDPQVAFLITELKLTTAALYNNASRRVARAEVEKLTRLTERELHDLHRLQVLLEKHVKELKSVNQ